MPLGQEILQLCEEVLAKLDSSHDYYFHTTVAWRVVQESIRNGNRIHVTNSTTGNEISEPELMALAQIYAAEYIATSTFQTFIALLEHFVLGVIRLWLTHYPANLSNTKLDFQVVLSANDRDEVIDRVVRQRVHALAYERSAEWFRYLERIAKIACPKQETLARLSEAKACRDAIVHSSGIATEACIARSAGLARVGIGERLPLPEPYHRETWVLVRQLVADLAAAAYERAPD